MIGRHLSSAALALLILAGAVAAPRSWAQGSWSPVAPLPSPRWGAAAAAGPDGRIYVLGGAAPQPTATVQVYDPGTNSWSYGASMPTARSFLRAVADGAGLIYALGGDGYTDSLRAAEVYHPTTDTWAPIAPMPTGRNGFGAVLGHDGRIYCVGGSVAGQPSDAMEIYNPSDNTWTLGSRMPTARTQTNAAVDANGRIYVVGGGTTVGPVAAVEIYSPDTDTWATGPQLPAPRSDHAVVTGGDGRVYALCGGDRMDGAQNTAVALDTTNQLWAGVASMAVGRNRPAAAVGADGRIYVIGGFSASGGMIASVEVYTMPVSDASPPMIVIAAPVDGGTYPVGQVVMAAYTATDASSGVAAVSGTVPCGTPLDTATVGTKAFTVTATDKAGNTAATTVTYTVGYAVSTLYDQTRCHKAGSTVPIKLQLVDANGGNVSASTVTVHATSTAPISGPPTGLLDDSGAANPDYDFRYDPTLGGTGGYVFNLSLHGYAPGIYVLHFRAGGDPTDHTAEFQVR